MPFLDALFMGIIAFVIKLKIVIINIACLKNMKQNNKLKFLCYLVYHMYIEQPLNL